ncbi:CAP domain-containing protein [Sphingomonas alba]|uniref:CAP domain-containing protein n=1 Tax=Sphingomonas alba TaxID=2908208 RepID=A0ABT0RIA7_9SPHN|nr:CAP domain-containing protein [Sphingomonas alba]MCL6682362.1 CAP domain-containing protein [Sphingomonas alba]
MAAAGGHFHIWGAGIPVPRFRLMCTPMLIAVVAVSSCVAEPSLVQRAPVPARPIEISAEAIAAHNRERSPVGALPISWDPSLAQAAALYAGQLAASGVLRHSPRQSRPGQGENLWMGTRGHYALSQMMGSWSAEKRYFRRGLFPSVSTTGNWADVGHYSQMIWPTTTRVGCAVASNAHADFLVCRYAPAGNIDGRRVP